MCQNAFILGQYSKCEQNFYQKEHHPDKVGVGGSSPLKPTILGQTPLRPAKSRSFPIGIFL